MNTRRLVAGLLSAALMATLMSGCGGTAEQTAAPTQQGEEPRPNEITVAIAQDLDDSLDPHKTVAAGTKEIMFNVFEGLVKPTPDGNLVPAVAESYELSEDGTVYTFTLRDGVKFHNGATVTAEDVVYSFDRCADITGGSSLVEALSVVTDVTAVDEKTVAITIAAPDNEFFASLTLAILPKGYEDQDTAPVGTGPFRYVSRAAQDNIVLERFDDYWGEPAKVEKVTLKVIENADSLVMSLQSGAVDLCAKLTSTQVAQLGDEFYVAEGTMNLVQALYLNHAVAPFDDLKVRQALCYAIDKQQAIDIACDGYGTPLGSSMYPGFGKYFLPELTNYYPHDVEKAKALLAEAGYPEGFDMTITAPSNYSYHVDVAQVLVEQLKAVGINAKIELVEWATWLSDVYSGRQFQATVVGLDASTMTARALLSRFESTAKRNFINYNSETYDALYAQAQATIDDAEQTELYKALERELTENAANVYIQDTANLVAVRKGLEGVVFYPIYVLDLSNVGWTE